MEWPCVCRAVEPMDGLGYAGYDRVGLEGLTEPAGVPGGQAQLTFCVRRPHEFTEGRTCTVSAGPSEP